MLKKIVISKLMPNPFRRLEEYPIQREKVDSLKKSIGTTGFWGTIVGRPATGGFIEIAFGHHRLVALQESFKADDSIEIIVRDLSNEDMLRMMASENMEEWGSSGWVELETIRSTIDAFDKGLIELPEVPKDARKDYVRKCISARPYTKTTVAQFLGWMTKPEKGRTEPNFGCETAFAALDAVGEGLVKESDLKGLTRGEIHNLVGSVRSIRAAEMRAAEQNRKDAERARELAAAAPTPVERKRLEQQAVVHTEQAKQHQTAAVSKPKDFAKKAADHLRNDGGVAEMRKQAEELKPVVERPAKVHNIDDLADRVARKLENVFNGDDDLSGDVKFLKQNRGDLSAGAARSLCQSSAALRARLMQKIENVFGSISSS